MWKRLAFGIFLTVTLAAQDTPPCVCADPLPACDAIGYSRVAFIGTVTNAADPTVRPAKTIATVRVETIFRVRPQRTAEIRIDPGAPTDCSPVLRVGERWLFVGDHYAATGILSTPLCRGSRKLRANDHEIAEVIDSYENHQNFVAVRVCRYKTPIRAAIACEVPISGAEVELTSGPRKLSGSTGSDGRIRFTNIAAAEYAVTVSATGFSPDPLNEYQAIKNWYNFPSPTRVPPVGCTEATIIMWPDQRISGKVIDAKGKPVVGIIVHARTYSPDAGLSRSGYTVITGRDGGYVFPRMLDGLYVIGVNVDPLARTDAYPVLFHPGTNSPANATLFQLTGTSIENVNLTLPARTRDFR